MKLWHLIVLFTAVLSVPSRAFAAANPWEVADQSAKVEAQLLGRATSLFAVKERNQQEDRELTGVVRALGRIHATSAVPLLIQNIAHVPDELPVQIRILTDRDYYVCLGAIIDIGGTALPQLLNRLCKPTIREESELCELGVIGILYRIIQPRDGASGLYRFARLMVDDHSHAVNDEEAHAQLAKTSARFAEKEKQKDDRPSDIFERWQRPKLRVPRSLPGS